VLDLLEEHFNHLFTSHLSFINVFLLALVLADVESEFGLFSNELVGGKERYPHPHCCEIVQIIDAAYARVDVVMDRVRPHVLWEEVELEGNLWGYSMIFLQILEDRLLDACYSCGGVTLH
jgi:hypothetical protein